MEQTLTLARTVTNKASPRVILWLAFEAIDQLLCRSGLLLIAAGCHHRVCVGFARSVARLATGSERCCWRIGLSVYGFRKLLSFVLMTGGADLNACVILSLSTRRCLPGNGSALRCRGLFLPG